MRLATTVIAVSYPIPAGSLLFRLPTCAISKRELCGSVRTHSQESELNSKRLGSMQDGGDGVLS